MQLPVHPDAAFHPCASVALPGLKRFEPNHQGRNDIARIGRKNRHGQNFSNCASIGADFFLDVSDLLRLRQFRQGQLCFRFAAQLPNFLRIRRFQDGPRSIEKPIESCVKRLRSLLRGRFFAFH